MTEGMDVDPKELHQIGEAAERTALSIRTIRYYEEIGLVVPSGRTAGGFRLYTDDDLDRLLLVKAMKPLDLSLETTQRMLEARDRLASGEAEADERRALLEDFEEFLAEARERTVRMQAGLEAAQQAVEKLRKELPHHRRPVRSRG